MPSVMMLWFLSIFSLTSAFTSLGLHSLAPSTTRLVHEVTHPPLTRSTTTTSTSRLFLFGKMFEEEGPLGKGITVGKIQVSLNCNDRGSRSIFSVMEKSSRNAGSTNQRVLADLANEVCLALLRRSDDWTAACSNSKWFGSKDAAKAESLFNDWSNREASKFEKEYIPDKNSEEKGGGPTLAVISLVVELQGDQTKFDGAGFSISGTRDVLSSIASDVLVERGSCLNAVEVFWTPSARDEVLTNRDVVLDFPELIDI